MEVYEVSKDILIEINCNFISVHIADVYDINKLILIKK